MEIADEVQSVLSHYGQATVWTNGVFFASNYTLESLESAVDNSDFAIAIAQPDDMTLSRGKESKTARDNVIFELGLFMGRLGRRRTILLQPKGQELRLPSDLVGLTTLSYKTGDASDLASRIATACSDIKKLIKEMGVRKYSHGN
ncbi:MAG: hypothetical protein EOP09_15585 [Proteobacteria bacterium]|nr:MAG: hypothetical protein EOP09_15585 [Pseudomonadota bacterium]